MIWNILKNFVGNSGKLDNKGYEDCRTRGARILASTVEPDAYGNVEWQIRQEFSLYPRWSSDSGTCQILKNEILAVKQFEGLAQVFMMHGDGRIREAALSQLNEPLIAPASVYVLFARHNDWVPEVRDAAARAANRCLPKTPADMITPALKALLPRAPKWQRWDQQGPKSVHAMLFREDIAKALLSIIIETRQSNLGLVFRELGRNPWIDQHLDQIFGQAPLPHLRAMALHCLISKKVRWPAHKKRIVWIDRSLHHFRVEPMFHERKITVDVTIPDCLLRGANDRASIVRKHVADALISLRHDVSMRHELDRVAHLLQEDRNFGVRERIDFFWRKRLEEDK